VAERIKIGDGAGGAMSLDDVLACPACKVPVDLLDGKLVCTQRQCEYPIVDGVPIMLVGGPYVDVRNEFTLQVQGEYVPWLHRMILQSLADDHVVLEVGSGNMNLDDPCIIRMEIALTPYVDVVGDLRALLFRSDSVDFIFGLAVFEHLRQPFVAAAEIYQVLKAGGYVYAEANFV
jgi:hypothetical protein